MTSGSDNSRPDDGLLDVIAPSLLELLDGLTTTMFCAKDASGRYLAVNATFVRRAGERSRRAVIGRRAADLFVGPLAQRYEEQDARVLGAGRTIRDELELIRSLRGEPRWHLTSKVPVRREGVVVGLVSVSEDLGARDVEDPTLAGLTRVLDLVRSRLDDPPGVSEMAAVAQCSPASLGRRVRRVFQLSPHQVVLRARIDHAAELLTTTDQPIAQLATAIGFYDQAAFSRTFARLSGETPAQFRRRQRAWHTVTSP